MRWLNKVFPIRVSLPNNMHVFNGNPFGLWEKLEDEYSHEHDKKCKENEESKLHVTELEVKICAMAKVEIMLTETLIL